eukprot:scaffold3077_cov162-Amphora_coffeaeformis.AAC.10
MLATSTLWPYRMAKLSAQLSRLRFIHRNSHGTTKCRDKGLSSTLRVWTLNMFVSTSMGRRWCPGFITKELSIALLLPNTRNTVSGLWLSTANSMPQNHLQHVLCSPQIRVAVNLPPQETGVDII